MSFLCFWAPYILRSLSRSHPPSLRAERFFLLRLSQLLFSRSLYPISSPTTSGPTIPIPCAFLYERPSPRPPRSHQPSCWAKALILHMSTARTKHKSEKQVPGTTRGSQRGRTFRWIYQRSTTAHGTCKTRRRVARPPDLIRLRTCADSLGSTGLQTHPTSQSLPVSNFHSLGTLSLLSELSSTESKAKASISQYNWMTSNLRHPYTNTWRLPPTTRNMHINFSLNRDSRATNTPSR